ncbi:MAG: CheR family methyltransferase [Alphaproteobacteria bacterium]
MSGVLSLKPSYYEALRRLTLELAGINLGKDHPFLIETRLRTLSRQEGYDSLLHMIEELFGRGEARLALQVVSSLLERDTHFNPDPDSIEYLQSQVLPSLGDIYGENTIRILSFGCSSGQETYSVAMQVDRYKAEYPGLKFEIVGVDYPSRALERAKRGVYTHFEVQRGLPIRDLVTYFDRKGQDWAVKQSLKDKVTFQEHHLMSNLASLGHFHLVFLRGRMASYTSGARMRVLRGLSSIVRPLGYLMIGSDEQMPNITYDFDIAANAPGVFQRRPPPEPIDVSENSASEALQAQRLTMLEKEMQRRQG